MQIKVFYLILLFLSIYSCKTSKNTEQLEKEHLKSFDAYKTPPPTNLKRLPNLLLCRDSIETKVATDTMTSFKAKKLAIIFFDPTCVECNMLGKKMKSSLSNLNKDLKICMINIMPNLWSQVLNYKQAYTSTSSAFEYMQLCTDSDISAFGTLSLTPTIFIFENGDFKEKHEVSVSDQDFKRIFQ